jgi:DNA polymerase elongation subunit (family B)
MLDNLNLHNVMVLDIETVPQYSSFDQLSPLMQKLWDDKTKKQRQPDETPAEFYRCAGIQAEFGKIICISAGMLNGENQFRVTSYASRDEHSMLVKFAEMLQKCSDKISKKGPNDKLILCGHNGKEFDFPYICRRLIVNGIKLPSPLNICGKKPWEVCHLDTMELWKCGDFKNYTSLNLLAAIFGIPTPKDDIDGSMVAEVYWQQDDLNRICEYCQKDVVTTAQVLRRFLNMELMLDEDIKKFSV